MSQIDSVSSGGDPGLSVLEMMHEIARGIAKDERDANHAARDAELAEGLAAADQMHEQASDTRTGAWVSGGLTIAGGAAQVIGAASLGDPTTDAAKAQNQRIQGWMDGAKAGGQLGGPVSQIYSAAAQDHAADGQASEARAKADGHLADEADDNRKEAQRIDESVLGLGRDIQDTHHQAVMAILSRS